MFLHGIVSAQLAHSPRLKSARDCIYSWITYLFHIYSEWSLGPSGTRGTIDHFLSVSKSKQVVVSLPAHPSSSPWGRPALKLPSSWTAGQLSVRLSCKEGRAKGNQRCYLRDYVASFVRMLNFIALSIKWEKKICILSMFFVKINRHHYNNWISSQSVNHSTRAVSVLVILAAACIMKCSMSGWDNLEAALF